VYGGGLLAEGSGQCSHLCACARAGHRARALAALTDGSITHYGTVAEAKRRFLDASIVDGRGGQHSTGVRWWILFCVWYLGKTPIPDPRDRSYEALIEIEDDLEDCAVWLAVTRPSGRQISHVSIGKYVSSIRAWYRRKTRAVLGLGASSRIADILKGYAREVPQPPPLERIGCTPADLAAGMRLLGLSRMWRAALVFGMAAIARGVEFALDASRGEAFETSEHMMPIDVRFFVAKDVRHARVRMRKRKDLRVLRGKQTDVIISGGGTHFDACDELYQWIQERRAAGIADDAPLFCRMNGQMITVEEVRAQVRAVMEAAGRDPSVYGAHSLRIGGASAALAAGVPPQLIRMMGRWSSDVYEIYCRMSEEAALSVGTAICSATVTDMSRSFHEEHLELLTEEVGEVCRFVDMPGEDEM
jgi:hypothetical protein